MRRGTAFTGSPLTGTTPLDVTFTDSSTGTSITNRRWDFGDGNVSNYAAATNPVHRYTGTGTYSVNLTVTNAGGSNSQLRSSYITVSALPGAPVAAFTGSPLTGTGPLDVTFTDSSTGTSITNRRWDFGDGNISNYGAATNPSHRYTSAGTYSVNLTVTNAGGSNSLVHANYITVTSGSTNSTLNVGVFRPSARQFIFNTAPVTRTTFGLNTDIPIIGDWDGDGTEDVGVFRPSARQFIFNTTPVTRTTFGTEH